MEVNKSSSPGATQSPFREGGVATSENPKKSFWSCLSFSFFGKKVKGVDPAPGAAERATINTKNSSIFASIRKWFASSGSGASSEKTDNKVRTWSFLNWFRKPPEKKDSENKASVPQNQTGFTAEEIAAGRADLIRAMNAVDNQVARKRRSPPKTVFNSTARRVASTYNSARPFHALALRAIASIEALQSDSTLSARGKVTVSQIDQTIYAWKGNIDKAVLSFTGTDCKYEEELPGVVGALQAAVDLLDPLSTSPEPSQEVAQASTPTPEQYQARITSLCARLEELCAARTSH